MALSFSIQLTREEWEKPAPICAIYQPTGVGGVAAFKVGNSNHLNTSTLLDTCQLLAHKAPTLSKILMDDLYRFYSLQIDAQAAAPPRKDHQTAIYQRIANHALLSQRASMVKHAAPHKDRAPPQKILRHKEAAKYNTHQFPRLNPTSELTPSLIKSHYNRATISKGKTYPRQSGEAPNQKLKEKEADPIYMLPLHHLRDIIIALTHYGNSLIDNTKALAGLDSTSLFHRKVQVKQLLEQWISLADHVLASQTRLQ